MRVLPKKQKGKGKRWPKGQSSSSNPQTRKFRDKAKSGFFNPNLETASTLTVGALQNLDNLNEKTARRKPPKPDDTLSISSWNSSKSAKTFASDWSNTSNISFSRFLNNFNHGSFLQKEMLAVLAAITEVIKSEGGTESSTEYFGALMTALEVCDTEDAAAAIVSLLNMGIKTVPEDVLHKKFEETCDTICNVLVKYSDPANPTIMKAGIGSLAAVLRIKGAWQHSNALQVFQAILSFSIHSKPKIRKSAQHAIATVLKSNTCEEYRPAAGAAAKFFLQCLESGGTNTTVQLHVLSVLKDVLSTFSSSDIKRSCEAILKMMTLGNAIVVSCGLEAMHGLFTSCCPESRLTPQLNAQLLNALYDYQPSANDVQQMLAWLTVMQEGHINLARVNPKLCGDNMVKFVVTATQLWLCDRCEVLQGTTSSLRAVIMDVVPRLRDLAYYTQTYQKVFSIVEKCLKYQYHSAWVYVFNILGTLFEVIGEEGGVYMLPCLKTLSELHESHNFTYTAELEFTIGRAIRFLGPETVLRAIPLAFSAADEDDLKQSWMLPVLKDNVQKSTIRMFCEYFLPMAARCERRAKDLNAANNRIGGHSYNLLQGQIWSLLPAFCSNADDVHDNFKVIAKTLGSLINDRKDLRLYVMTALRKMITRNQELSKEENLKELGKYAKNYVPILFNIYTTKPSGGDEEGQRLAAMETIKVYLSITSPELNGQLFDKALSRLEEPDIAKFDKEAITDLVKLMTPYQDMERVRVVYDMCMGLLKNTECRTEEKKGYRLLEELCSSTAPSCVELMDLNLSETLEFLLKSLKNKKVTNTGARLRCLLHIARKLNKDQVNVLKAIVPEAIMCCKNINKKARAFAFQLLEELFTIAQGWWEGTPQELIREYIMLVMTGLTGPKILVSATLLALTKLTYTLREQLPTDVLNTLLDTVLTLTASPIREVVGPCLGFFKLYITAFPKDLVSLSLPPIVKAIVEMTDDCKRHFRLKTRDILDRVLRKFGYETLRLLVPADDTIMHKRLKNLKKINEKKNAGKCDVEEYGDEEFSAKAKSKSIDNILASSDESDLDEEEDQGKGKKQKRKKAAGNLYIQENANDIVDFTAATASRAMTTTKPTPAKASNAKDRSHFRTTEDGRLVIQDDDDDAVSDPESDIDDVASELAEIELGRKRKRAGSVSEPASKYQAGGSGIHRPLNQPPLRVARRGKQQIEDTKTGKEYKAKKARGDMKLKGKPDPYAYIPLSRKVLGKRNKLKNSRRFDSMVKSAVKGAKAGARAKVKRRK